MGQYYKYDKDLACKQYKNTVKSGTAATVSSQLTDLPCLVTVAKLWLGKGCPADSQLYSDVWVKKNNVGLGH